MSKFERIFAILLLVFLATGYLIYLKQSSVSGEMKNGSMVPMDFGEWKGTDLMLVGSALDIIKPDAFIYRNYRNNNNIIVNVFIGYYSNLHNSDSAHSPLICYPGQGWEILEHEDISWVLKGREATFSRLLVRLGSSYELVFFGYGGDNFITSSLGKLRTRLILNRIFGKSASNSFIRLSIPVIDNNGELSQQHLKRFLTDFYTTFELFMDLQL